MIFDTLLSASSVNLASIFFGDAWTYQNFFDLSVLTLVLQENHCNYTFTGVENPMGQF